MLPYCRVVGRPLCLLRRVVAVLCSYDVVFWGSGCSKSASAPAVGSSWCLSTATPRSANCGRASVTVCGPGLGASSCPSSFAFLHLCFMRVWHTCCGIFAVAANDGQSTRDCTTSSSPVARVLRCERGVECVAVRVVRGFTSPCVFHMIITGVEHPRWAAGRVGCVLGESRRRRVGKSTIWR